MVCNAHIHISYAHIYAYTIYHQYINEMGENFSLQLQSKESSMKEGSLVVFFFFFISALLNHFQTSLRNNTFTKHC